MDQRYDRPSFRVVLPTREAVRRRPGMYVGDVEDGSALFDMVLEVISNSLDQFLAGRCTRIHVTLRADGAIQVDDDGAGIPTHEVDGIPFLQRVLTQLHLTPTADGHAPHEHLARGVGLFVVHALSTQLCVQTHYQGQHYSQTYEHGEPSALACHGPSAGRGTSLWFIPDPEIFGEVSIDAGAIASRLRDLASLLPGIELGLTDQRVQVFRETQSLEGLLRRMPRYTSPERIGPIRIGGTLEQIRVDALLAWLPGFTHRIESFANVARTSEHGTHVDGLLDALAGAVRTAFPEESAAGKAQELCERALQGLHAVVCVRLTDPTYGHPTRDELSTPAARTAVTTLAEPALCAFFADNPALREHLLKGLS